MTCHECLDPTTDTCDACRRPVCDECDQRNAAESLEAVGGEAVARAHARAIRAQREYDMEANNA